jgi:hypothetical protein
VDILAFEFEMGLFPAVLEEARGKGIDLTPKYIPAEVFDKRAVDKGHVVFHDISFVEATPRYDQTKKLAISIELTVGLLQPGCRRGRDRRHEGRQERGHVRARPLVQGDQKQDGVIKKDRLTKHWTDWADYWAVDFAYLQRKEIIKVPVG